MKVPKSAARLRVSADALIAALTLLGISAAYSMQPNAAEQGPQPKYLFVCAGDQARVNPDFLAVVNFDEDSEQYGEVLATAPLPEPGAIGLSHLFIDPPI